MPEFTAALFATKNRPWGEEQSLIAHALLFEGSRPCWEIHIHDKVFRFIPNPSFIIEDALWQLNDYCHISENEYKHDQHQNAPLTLEEEFGEAICAENRNSIATHLANNGVNFKLITWPGFAIHDLSEKIAVLKKAGVSILW
jgi:hypothetical protein